MSQLLAESPIERAVTIRRGWSAKTWRVLAVLNFTALIAAAVTLRVWQLGTVPGLNGDEAWLGVQAERLVAGEPIAWHTPTGNPVNPFLLFPEAALHRFFAPSVDLLRSMAVVSGLLALAANFWLCRKVFDLKTALVSTALLAVMPITIAYSRFAWDSCQTPLATVLVLYAALALVPRSADPSAGLPKPKRRSPEWLPTMMLLGAAVWVHPTNIFLVWLVVVPAVVRYRAQWREALERLRGQRRSLVWIGAVVGLFPAAIGGSYFQKLVVDASQRAIDPDEAGLFLRLLVRLFSGGTVLEFIPGPPRTTSGLDVIDMALLALFAVAALGLVVRLKRPDSRRERCLAGAFGLILLSFYLVGGPAAIGPHFERYGMCLVVPGALLLALGWGHWLGQGTAPSDADFEARRESRRRARLTVMLLSTTAWLWLIHFYHDYFGVFAATGGSSHVAFRSAEVEPKLTALDAILDAESQRPVTGSHASKRIWIVADSWWSYWPLEYFAYRRPEVRVVEQANWPAERKQVSPADSVWRAQFRASDHVTGTLAAHEVIHRSPGHITILDQAGAPLLDVQRLRN